MNRRGNHEPVLIVDDDAVCLKFVHMLLVDAGYEPFVADDGIKALAIFHHRQPRVVICDWQMPRIDGVQVCKEIRSLQGNPPAHFIMLTVESDKNRLVEAFDAGVDDFLSKPFHQGELLARLRAGLKTVALAAELNAQAQAIAKSNAELHRLNERLHEIAAIDDLTKLFTRRQAMMRLREQWARSTRHGDPLSCAMIDVDNFKRVNDTYGHLKGDEVLQKIGTVLLQSVRAEDSVFRMGGEEFMILFPNQDAREASICAERCRARTETSVFLTDDQLNSTTISIGVAQRNPAMRGMDDLLNAADKALYAAKDAGRNRLAVAAQGQ